MSSSGLELLIRSQDWVYENAGLCWPDGLILGNGNIGVIGYAPYGLEWVLNKGDIFDGRVYCGKLLPHREVMARFLKDRPPNLKFLDELEKPEPGMVPVSSNNAAVLNLSFGNEYSWGAARPHKVKQRLSLWEGELYYEMDLHMSHPRVRCLVPRNRNIFCVRLEHSAGAVWNHNVVLNRPFDEDLRNPEWHVEEGIMAFRQAMPHDHVAYAVAVCVVPTTGPDQGDLFNRLVHRRWRMGRSSTGRPTAWTYQGVIPQSGNADIFVAIYTTYEAKAPVAAAMAEARKAARLGFAALERENQRWWKGYWEKSWADFGAHHDIQKYWTFSAYETACLLGKAPAAVYGLWNGPTGKPRQGIGSNYCHDQNVQMPLMPVCVLNHVELVEPLADTYLRVLPELKRQTRELFESKGAFLPLAMNLLGRNDCPGHDRYSLCGAAYSGLILAWAWRYSRNKKLLREKLYPLLVEFVRFYVDTLLAKGDDGRYHLGWCVPPELDTMSRDETVTLATLKPCLETVIEASRLFKIDAREREKWEDIIRHYPPFPRRSCGDWWPGADIPEDHHTQAAYLLYPFFPGEACVDNDAERTAALTLKNSIYHDIELSYANEKGRWHYARDWAWFFPTMTRIRLGQVQAGWKALRDGIHLFSKPNGLFTHNPVLALDPKITEANLKHIPRRRLRHSDGVYSPLHEFQHMEGYPSATLNPNAGRWVIPSPEGNAGFLLAATETLLQSHGGLIRLFPCVPSGFSGEFHHLLAQGAFEVSARMKAGRMEWVKIRALAGGTVRIRIPGKRAPDAVRKWVVDNCGQGPIIEIAVKKGKAWEYSI